ncbi:hypothetical protein NL676_002743 [Syzygium grande]|nr:hypothetical protein NL676_002743 [Syzygium grande]
MAFLQMKRVVAEVLRRFRVVPAAEEGEEPLFISYLSSKMKGGFPDFIAIGSDDILSIVTTCIRYLSPSKADGDEI